MQLERGAEGVGQIGDVTVLQLVGLVTVNHDRRRIAAALVAVAQLDAAAEHGVRRMLFDGGDQHPVQLRRGHLASRCLVAGDDMLHQFAQPGTVQRGHEIDRHVVEEWQLELDHLAHPLALVGIQPVPLVDRQHHRPAVVGNQAHHARVMGADLVMSIDHRDHHVGAVDRLQRLDDRELLDHFGDARLAPDAGGVDQLKLPAAPFERHGDRVARGAGLVRGQHPVLANQAVQQGRLAGVRAADDRDANGAVVELRVFDGDRGCLQQFAQQATDAVTELGGNHRRFAKAQLVEVGDQHLGHAFRLVGQQPHRLAELAQRPGDLDVAGHQAGLGIDEEQHVVGVLDGDPRLRFGKRGQRIGGLRHQATGVDDDEALALELALAVLAIARQAGVVGNQRIAAVGEAVEQRRLADIRATDKRDHRQHVRIAACLGVGIGRFGGGHFRDAAHDSRPSGKPSLAAAYAADHQDDKSPERTAPGAETTRTTAPYGFSASIWYAAMSPVVSST